MARSFFAGFARSESRKMDNNDGEYPKFKLVRGISQGVNLPLLNFIVRSQSTVEALFKTAYQGDSEPKSKAIDSQMQQILIQKLSSLCSCSYSSCRIPSSIHYGSVSRRAREEARP
jgi:hypothetical protein